MTASSGFPDLKIRLKALLFICLPPGEAYGTVPVAVSRGVDHEFLEQTCIKGLRLTSLASALNDSSVLTDGVGGMTSSMAAARKAGVVAIDGGQWIWSRAPAYAGEVGPVVPI